MNGVNINTISILLWILIGLCAAAAIIRIPTVKRTPSVFNRLKPGYENFKFNINRLEFWNVQLYRGITHLLELLRFLLLMCLLIAAMVLVVRPETGKIYDNGYSEIYKSIGITKAEYVKVVSFILLTCISIVHAAFIVGKSIMISTFSIRESLYRPVYNLTRFALLYVMVIIYTPDSTLNVKKLMCKIFFICVTYVVLYIVRKCILIKILDRLNLYIDIENAFIEDAYKDLLIPEEITNSYSVVGGAMHPVDCTIQLRIIYSMMFIAVENKRIPYLGEAIKKGESNVKSNKKISEAYGN